jgi:hypothetical protein
MLAESADDTQDGQHKPVTDCDILPEENVRRAGAFNRPH